MILSELWRLYEADKRIQSFRTSTLKAYSLQLKMLLRELGDLDTTECKVWFKKYLESREDTCKVLYLCVSAA